MSVNKQSEAWWVFKLSESTDQPVAPHEGIKQLPLPPPWRRFKGPVDEDERLRPLDLSSRDAERGRTFRPSYEAVRMINAALYLRRPLLLTGLPGSGKSTLAYAVAYQLQLGPVLHWPITTRSTLTSGLYTYDAVARLQDAHTNLSQPGVSLTVQSDASSAGQTTDTDQPDVRGASPNIGDYIKLGPLGTALLPSRYPRVLLIDEIDKSDIDLPNDLLHVFEEGEFVIPELARFSKKQKAVPVQRWDSASPEDTVIIEAGKVRCHAFPFVVLTSNAEREFPPAFLRRCLRLRIEPPDRDQLQQIVAAHFADEPQTVQHFDDLIDDFLRRRGADETANNLATAKNLATDQLLNVIHMAMYSGISRDKIMADLGDVLLKPLNET